MKRCLIIALALGCSSSFLYSMVLDVINPNDLSFLKKEFGDNTIEQFLKQSLDQSQQEALGTRALLKAIRANNESLAAWLIGTGLNVNTSDDNGHIPLVVASATGNYALCKLLLDHNADIDCSQLDGSTAMTKAAAYGNTQLFDLFLEHGANINHQRSWNGNTPLHEAVRF